MQTSLIVAAALLTLSAFPAAAFDDAKFCSTMIEQSKTGQLEAAVWLDEFTREETVAVQCSMRMVEFTRHLDMLPADMDDAWRRREKSRWNEAHCSNPDWRQAIRNGWTIASTLVTPTGERIWFAARCR